MSEINSYRDLIAWQKAFALGLRIHRLAGTFPDHERFALTAVLRRAAILTPKHIAEGYGKGQTDEYLRQLRQARSLLYEQDTELLFALELGYVKQEIYDAAKRDLDEAERVLAGLIRSISR